MELDSTVIEYLNLKASEEEQAYKERRKPRRILAHHKNDRLVYEYEEDLPRYYKNIPLLINSKIIDEARALEERGEDAKALFTDDFVKLFLKPAKKIHVANYSVVENKDGYTDAEHIIFDYDFIDKYKAADDYEAFIMLRDRIREYGDKFFVVEYYNKDQPYIVGKEKVPGITREDVLAFSKKKHLPDNATHAYVYWHGLNEFIYSKRYVQDVDGFFLVEGSFDK